MGALSFLAPFLPYIAGLAAILLGYFTIRQRGVVAERERQAKVIARIQGKVVQAQSKDVEIDKKVEAKIEAIKEQVAPEPSAPDVFKF